MLPATRGLADYLRSSESPDIEPVDEPAVHEDRFDPKIMQLQLKRKRQLEMVKKMLMEGGYEDLAKMTSLTKRDLDDTLGE